MSPRRPALAALAAVATLLLSSCSFGGWVYDSDLPGGAKLGSDPLTVTADFDDVLDLVPQSSVKVDDVAVGRVSRITLQPDGHSARVTLLVNRKAALPAGTTARIEQTSLLGEKYVALVPPRTTTASSGQLESGARLPLDTTSAAAQVEEVLGALSMVLNGGGIGQFQEISRELQKVSDGRNGEIRDFLDQITRFVTTLDARKDSITAALDGLDRLSASLSDDDEKIARALDGLSPGMKVLEEQRPQLIAMLESLDELSDVTVSTLHRSQADIVADFKALDPILSKLAQAGADLPDSLQILLTYPFPDSVLGAIKGDYLNVFMTTNFRTVSAACAGVGCAWPQVGGSSAGASGRSSFLPHAAPSTTEAPPTLLPATDSPMPGAVSPTVPGPSILTQVPSRSASGSSSGTASVSPSGSPSASDERTPSSPSSSQTDDEGR